MQAINVRALPNRFPTHVWFTRGLKGCQTAAVLCGESVSVWEGPWMKGMDDENYDATADNGEVKKILSASCCHLHGYLQ